jgi:hypothetical protein
MVRWGAEKIVVDSGYAVDPVHYRPPNQPQSLDQPRKVKGVVQVSELNYS